MNADPFKVAVCEATGGHFVEYSRENALALFQCTRCQLTDEGVSGTHPIFLRLQSDRRRCENEGYPK